jgi:hypothetical protein
MPQQPSQPGTTTLQSAVAPPPSLLRWTGLCTLAETVGMTAAAAAAKGTHMLVGEPSDTSEVALALGLAVAGGLVEGVALGTAQSAGLSVWLGTRGRAGWLLATVAVAGLGWAAASTPAVLAGEGGTEPPLPLMLAGALGIGLVMGAALGAAQAIVLRHRVPHPWRWVGANMAAWAVAMPIIFVGASTPASGWALPAVLGWGALTGAVAGAALGLVSGRFLPSLARQDPLR